MIDPLRMKPILEEIAAHHILPLFRNLQSGDIREKTPGDPVTAADIACEEALTPILRDLLPGSLVVGEEAASADPSVIGRLQSDVPVWIIDPIDGTLAFVAGEDNFGTMVALSVKGEPVQSWIYLPTQNRLMTAERGSGCYIDGQKKTCPPTPRQPQAFKAALGSERFYPEAFKSGLAHAKAQLPSAKDAIASAVEYMSLVEGLTDAVFYSRLYPWDHAAGILALTEAGGHVSHLTGKPYRTNGPLIDPLIAAGDRAGFELLYGLMAA
jgi:fructose-1,6-bisphosphatase/inositol monophosphatase family enzyme